MKLKNILIILTIIVLYSGCSSKDEFYKGAYNFIQDDNFCATTQECENKRLHPNDYNKNEKMNYDNYKNSIK